MKLNFWERLLVNNPVRSFVQHHIEAKRLLALGGRIDGKKALEIGCGRGVGIEVILERFGAGQVTAIDLDPRMVALAKERLAAYPQGRISILVGNATAIDAPSGTFDAVFDFGILHHVEDWQKAIEEIVRVLKPGGIFFFEEVTKQALDRWVYRTFLDHPKENRFSAEDFVRELRKHGLTVDRTEPVLSHDIFAGVGRRVGS